MCNRYRLKTKPDELIDLFRLPRDISLTTFAGEYFPGSRVPEIHEQDVSIGTNAVRSGIQNVEKTTATSTIEVD